MSHNSTNNKNPSSSKVGAQRRSTNAHSSRKRASSSAAEPHKKKIKNSSTTSDVRSSKGTVTSQPKKHQSVLRNDDDDDNGQPLIPHVIEADTSSESAPEVRSSEDEPSEIEDSDEELGELTRSNNTDGLKTLLREETAMIIASDSDADAAQLKVPSKRKGSARKAKMEAETPRIIQSSDEDDNGTPPRTTIVPRRRKGIELHLEEGKKIGLIGQTDRVRSVIRSAFKIVGGNMIFENAYPELTSRYPYARNALIRAAGTLGDTTIVQRLRSDQGYGDRLAELVRQHVVQIRSNVKGFCYNHIKDLVGKIPNVRVTLQAFAKAQTYHFPISFATGQILDTKKPYGNPMISDIAWVAFFTDGKRGAVGIGNRERTRFTSSVWNKPEEKELPIAMVAFICTGIHYALLELSNPSGQTASNFTNVNYYDIYLNHASSLERSAGKSPSRFHATMKKLYDDVQSGSYTLSASGIDPLALAEWSGDEDLGATGDDLTANPG